MDLLYRYALISQRSPFTRREKQMKVLLVYPPNQLMPIETPRPDGSLGLLYLAGALRQIGIEPDLLDMTVGTNADKLENTFFRSEEQENGLVRIGMSWERIEESVQGYDIVAINSNFTPQTKMALHVVALAKKAGALVVCGGINARALAPRFLKNGVNVVCMGEGETTIKQVAMGRAITKLPVLTNLDELPFPAWDLLPFEKYEQINSPHGIDLTGKRERYAPLMTSRGCPFRCMYCHISQEKGNIGELRVKSVERVLQEIAILKSLGVTKVFIEDDSLLAKKERIRRIFTAIRGEGLTIADTNGVNLVHFFKKTPHGLEPDEDYMALLAEAGLKQIVFPVESGSQRVLDKYATGKLNLATMDVLKLVHVARKVGIICPANMMLGFPDETLDEMMVSIALGHRLIEAGAAYITPFIPIPFPGSVLYDIAIAGGHLEPDFDPDIMNWKNGVMKNTAVPKEKIVEIRDQAAEAWNPEEHILARLQASVKTRILTTRS